MRVLKTVIAFATAMGLTASAYAAGETVLVAGASGKSGKPLIKILADQGYKVRAMVRDKAKAGDLGAGVEVVQADVTDASTLAAALKGATFVISTIGATSPAPPNNPENVDFKGVVSLVDAAKAAGIRHFVLMSSIGAGDPKPETMLNKVFGMVLLWKGKGEDHRDYPRAGNEFAPANFEIMNHPRALIFCTSRDWQQPDDNACNKEGDGIGQ